MKRINVFAYALIAVLFLSTSGHAKNSIYVSPNGNDNNPGTLEQPLATLEKAAEKAEKEGNA